MQTSNFESFDGRAEIISASANNIVIVGDASGHHQYPDPSFSFRSRAPEENLIEEELVKSNQSDKRQYSNDYSSSSNRAALRDKITKLVAAGTFFLENGNISNQALNLIQQFIEQTPRKQSYEDAAAQLQAYLNFTISFQNSKLNKEGPADCEPRITVTFARVSNKLTPISESRNRIHLRPNILALRIGENTQLVPIRIFTSSWDKS